MHSPDQRCNRTQSDSDPWRGSYALHPETAITGEQEKEELEVVMQNSQFTSPDIIGGNASVSVSLRRV